MKKPVETPLSYYAESNTRFVFLDGNTCSHLEQCYTTLIQQLSIPGYFGRNLDALEEIFSDLDWIAEERVKVIILNVPGLLKQEPEKKHDLMDILLSSRNEKLEVIYLG